MAPPHNSHLWLNEVQFILADTHFAVPDFMKFMKKERIADATLLDAIDRVERGLMDADLGGGLLKLRVARPGQGRSTGYRTIVTCRVGARAFFLVGFGKNDLVNIGDATLAQLRRVADELQRLTDDELDKVKGSGVMREIER